MRKVFLRLTQDSDLYVSQDRSMLWHLRNRGNDMCVVRQGRICRSIVHGVYIQDFAGIHGNKLLTAITYKRIHWS